MSYNDYELLDLIMENDEVAYDIMINKYKNIIYSRASEISLYFKNYYNSTFISYDDLIIEGFVALNRAIKSFDQDKGALFYSYFLVCLNSSYNLFLRGVFTKKNLPLLNYKELDFEVNDFNCIDPYNYIDINDNVKSLNDYIYSLDLIEGAILELRLQRFKYKEIITLLEVTSSKISRVINKFRNQFTNIL